MFFFLILKSLLSILQKSFSSEIYKSFNELQYELDSLNLFNSNNDIIFSGYVFKEIFFSFGEHINKPNGLDFGWIIFL